MTHLSKNESESFIPGQNLYNNLFTHEPKISNNESEILNLLNHYQHVNTCYKWNFLPKIKVYQVYQVYQNAKNLNLALQQASYDPVNCRKKRKACSLLLLLLLLKTLSSRRGPIYWTKYLPTFIQQIFSRPYLTDIWHTWGLGSAQFAWICLSSVWEMCERGKRKLVAPKKRGVKATISDLPMTVLRLCW